LYIALTLRLSFWIAGFVLSRHFTILIFISFFLCVYGTGVLTQGKALSHLSHSTSNLDFFMT
jgi:hypothetical protein